MRIFPVYEIKRAIKDCIHIEKVAKSGKNFILNNPSEIRDFTDVDYVINSLYKIFILKKFK